jgi:hypothetical protein
MNWQPGDQVGTGTVHLPTAELREAYGLSCKAMLVQSWVRRICKMKSVAARRYAIERCPKSIRADVENAVRNEWAARSKN